MTYRISLPEAIELAFTTPENEYQRLMFAWCKTIVDTWSASCATDRYVDLTPYRDAEKAAKDAFEAYILNFDNAEEDARINKMLEKHND